MSLKQVFAGMLASTTIMMGAWTMDSQKAAFAQEAPAPEVVPEANLAGTSWKLVSWGTLDNLSEPVSTDGRLTNDRFLTAEFTENIVKGSSGCYPYGFLYQTSDNILQVLFDEGAFETVYIPSAPVCSEEVGNQENRYQNALLNAQSYQITETGLLEISYNTDTESGVLIFERNFTPYTSNCSTLCSSGSDRTQ